MGKGEAEPEEKESVYQEKKTRKRETEEGGRREQDRGKTKTCLKEEKTKRKERERKKAEKNPREETGRLADDWETSVGSCWRRGGEGSELTRGIKAYILEEAVKEAREEKEEKTYILTKGICVNEAT